MHCRDASHFQKSWTPQRWGRSFMAGFWTQKPFSSQKNRRVYARMPHALRFPNYQACKGLAKGHKSRKVWPDNTSDNSKFGTKAAQHVASKHLRQLQVCSLLHGPPKLDFTGTKPAQRVASQHLRRLQ
eukprot:scaffold255099_cov17-Tisochrysis_lutea.AAC.1